MEDPLPERPDRVPAQVAAPGATAASISLRELLTVLTVVGFILALLARGPGIGHRLRMTETVAQAMLRDLETAIKAYESDHGRLPPSNPAADEADNRALVAALSLRGPRGACYYVFRPEQLRGPLPPNLKTSGDLSAFPGGCAAFPEAMSPLGSSGALNAAGDRRLHNIFYRVPGCAFNRTGFELWTGQATPSALAHDPSPLPAGAPGLPADPSDADRCGGVGAGRYYSRINNWR